MKIRSASYRILISALAAAAFIFTAPRAHAICDAGVVFDLTNSTSQRLGMLCDALLSEEGINASVILSWEELSGLSRDPEAAGKLKKLVAAGRLEVLSGTYYNLNFALSPPETLYSQIKRYKLLAESVTGSQAGGFWPNGLSVTGAVMGDLKNEGFNYCLVSENQVDSAGEERRLQPQLAPDGLIVYPVSSSVSNAASTPLVSGWLDNFRSELGRVGGDISDSIPGGVLVFSIDLKNYTQDSLKELFSVIKLLGIKTYILKDFYSRQPSYFGELQAVKEPPAPKLSMFQKVILGQWKYLSSDAAGLIPELKETACSMGNGRFYTGKLTAEKIKEIISLSSAVLGRGKLFEFDGPGGKILAVSNGYFTIYFLEESLTPLFIISQKLGKCVSGDPFAEDPPPAIRNYFNMKSFSGLWHIEKQEAKGSFRLSAALKAAPFELKKTFVFASGRDIIKMYLSVKNTGEKNNSCEVALDVSPSGRNSVFLTSADGNFYGRFDNVSKEFNGIKKAAFPVGGNAMVIDFLSNNPAFMSSRKNTMEFVYGRGGLAVGQRLLFETHISWKKFSVPENTLPLVGYSEIILDGAPNETLWASAQHVIDPMRDGAAGSDITSVYYKNSHKTGYLYLEGDLKNTDCVYVVRNGSGPVKLPGGVTTDEGAEYFVRVPLSEGAPAAYRWSGLWIATFEKGFAFSSSDKSLEMRLPWAFADGDWTVCLTAKDKTTDSAEFRVGP